MQINEMQEIAESEAATPEEEAQYEQALDVAMSAMHQGKVAKNTVNRVLNAKDLATGVAEAAFVLIRKTEVELKGLMDAVKVQLGEDIVIEILGMMVESERITEGEVTDELVEKIVNAIYLRYTEDAQKRGALDPKEIEADLAQAQPTQGTSAMSNQEVQARGLMNV